MKEENEIELEEKPIDRGIGGFNSKLCKISRDNIPSLLKRIEEGESLVDIAKDYGCHSRTVRQAVRRYMQELSNKGDNE